MKIEDIEIHAGKPDHSFKVIGPIKAQVGAATIFSRTPTLDEVNQKLREQAVQMGANAVIETAYDRGISMSSWKAITATGTAVILDKTAPPVAAQDAESRLAQLTAMRQKGLVTDAEFEMKRREILNQL